MKLQPGYKASMQPFELLRPAILAIATLLVNVGKMVLEPLHRNFDLPRDLQERLRPFPKHLRIALVEILVDRVQVQNLVLNVAFLFLDLVAPHHGVFELAQHIAGIPLALFVFRRKLVGQKDHG